MARLGRSRPARAYKIISHPTGPLAVTSSGAMTFNPAIAGSVTVLNPITATGAMTFNPAISASGFLPITSTGAMTFNPAIAAVDSETIAVVGAMTFNPSIAGLVTIANPVTAVGAMSFNPSIAGSGTQFIPKTPFGVISQWDGGNWIPYQAGIAESTSAIFPNTIGLTELDVGLVYAGIVDATTINAATFVGTDWLENSAGGFYYSSAPATGNLTASIAPASGTDAHGNAYQAGVYAYGPNGSFAGLMDNGSFAELQLLPPGPVTQFTSHPALLSYSVNPGAANEGMVGVFTSGQESGNNYGAVLTFSAPANNAAAAGVGFAISNTTFGTGIFGLLNSTAFTLFGIPIVIGSQTQPNVQLIPSNASFISNNTVFQVQTQNAGASNEQLLALLTSGKESGNADAALQLFSNSADNTLTATAKLEFGGAVGLTVTSAGISAPNYSSGHNAAGWPIASGATIGTVSGSNVIIASGFLGALNNLRNAAVASGAIT